MSDEFDLIAELREDEGKGASRRLRRGGRVPAIIYGAGRPPRMLAFDHNKVIKQLENESFFSSILNIKVGDKSQAAILKDVQRHPAKPQILHMDFQRVVEDQEIRMNVPLHFIGENIAPGVKMSGGKVSHLMTDVEVVCLPKHLPEFLEVDVSELGLDEMLYLSDIKVPEGVTLTDLVQGEGHNLPVVAIHVIKDVSVEEEVGEEGAVPSAEVPTVGDTDDDSED